MLTKVISPLQQELESQHGKLLFLHAKLMFLLAKLGFLPKRFIEMNDDVPLCLSCMSVNSRHHKWITKEKNQGVYIRTLTINQDPEYQLTNFSYISLD